MPTSHFPIAFTRTESSVEAAVLGLPVKAAGKSQAEAEKAIVGALHAYLGAHPETSAPDTVRVAAIVPPDDASSTVSIEVLNASLKSKARSGLSPKEFGAVLVAGFAYVAGYAYFTLRGRSHFINEADAGTFGDMFGSINAFASGAAMFALVIALLLQRRQNEMQSEELALQRDELAHTRVEIAGQREALEGQLDRWDKDYVERNKPIVFSDRVEHPLGGFDYVMRNVGGGFAVNVYYVDPSAAPDGLGVWPVRALGSLAPHSERTLPRELNRAFCDSAKHPVPHLLIAEGPYSRTTQWTPTLNYRSRDLDPREGHVLHRVATVPRPAARLTRQPLALFLNDNAGELFRQLASLGTRED